MIRKISILWFALFVVFFAVNTIVGQAPYQIDGFGNIKDNDTKARIDMFYTALGNEPGKSGFIAIYGTTKSEAANSQKRIENAIRFRKFDRSRVVIKIVGCWNELWNELWLVPNKATQPPFNKTTACRTNTPTRRTTRIRTRKAQSPRKTISKKKS